MKIEFDKVVTNALSALVVTTFLGAAAIVWKGATTVDSKVQQTRSDMEHLINALSDQLASYQSQLTTFSNQLSMALKSQNNPVAAKPPTEREAFQAQQQKAYRSDIYQNLIKK